MHFDRRGSGPPLVLIHGIGSRWQVWAPLLPALAVRYDVIAVDLPGFGASPPTAAADVPSFADEVATLLADLGIDRPRIAGSSLGGGIALELGRRGAARAVAAFSPVGFFGPIGAAWCRAVVGGARAGGSLLEPVLPRLLATRSGRTALCGVFYGRPSARPAADCVADARALVAAPGFTATRRQLGRWRFGAEAPLLAAGPGGTSGSPIAVGGPDGAPALIPVTIAWGTRDLVLPRYQARRARAALPYARHVTLNGCGHLPFADDPATCSRLLLDL